MMRTDPLDTSVLARHLTIGLTTIGWRSGKPRRIEIWWFHVNGRFIITGTPGLRDWYANVLTNPEVTIHVAGLDLPASAHPVQEHAIRAAVFDTPSTRWYSTQAQRQRLIDESPMIEVAFAPPSQRGTAGALATAMGGCQLSPLFKGGPPER